MSSNTIRFVIRSSIAPTSLVSTAAQPSQCSTTQHAPSTSSSSSLQQQHQHQLHHQTEPHRFNQSLLHHRTLINDYKNRWDYNNPTSRTPTTSWPTDIPSSSILPSLRFEHRFCSRSPNYRDTSSYCDNLQFRIAYSLLIHSDDDNDDDVDSSPSSSGLHLLKDLAERGHPDAMCAYGTTLMQGHPPSGLEPHPQLAVAWFRRCVEMYDHPQATYELGVALFTGEGVVEDEAAGARYFRKAALLGHAGAAFMYGDCLLEGVGVKERDRATALEWLVKAGELGHRGARSRVLAVLEMTEGGDYGLFTDGSRQTFKKEEEVGMADDEEEEDELMEEEERRERELEQRLQWSMRGMKFQERRYTNMGSGPAVINRRKTKVKESREES